MDPSDKNPSKLYCNFKIHKPHDPLGTPPVRPIISGSGSITENISIYVEHYIKEISMQHRAFLQDTPHLLRIIHKINQGPKIPNNAMIVTLDAIGAYQNIPQDDGIDCLFEALEERPETSEIMELKEMCEA